MAFIFFLFLSCLPPQGMRSNTSFLQLQHHWLLLNTVTPFFLLQVAHILTVQDPLQVDHNLSKNNKILVFFLSH